MKAFGIFLVTIVSVYFGYLLAIAVISEYKYEKDYLSYWELADKASTIEQKAEYIDKFVASLEKANLNGVHNAVLLQTPDNSFDMNFKALKSFQSRLHEIKDLDPESFQYNTAISQITAQEQGEANRMLSIFKGCWYKENYFPLWSWPSILINFFIFIIGVIGAGIWARES